MHYYIQSCILSHVQSVFNSLLQINLNTHLKAPLWSCGGYWLQSKNPINYHLTCVCCCIFGLWTVS